MTALRRRFGGDASSLVARLSHHRVSNVDAGSSRLRSDGGLFGALIENERRAALTAAGADGRFPVQPGYNLLF